MTSILLRQEALNQLSDAVARPAYNRDQLVPAVVHIGVGGFHRAHQAYYLHQLASQTANTDWGISGIGLRENDRAMDEVLRAQDGLYTLVTQHPDGTADAEVIGTLTEYILAVDDPERALERLAAPTTRIVSLTITEGGYNFDPGTGEFNFGHPDIVHDLEHPQRPRSVFGYLAEALRRRKAAGRPAFTILSCDNVQHNGNVARNGLLAFAGRQDPELRDWIAAEVRFPNSMVDRITPSTTPEDIAELQERFGVDDGWPVVCEPYIQWVIEDSFSNGRPPLEQLGVQFVPDVTPYEKMKLRLLNAGHSVLAIPGALHGHPTIDACMRDPVFAGFLRAFMDEEATPVLDPVAGINLTKYKDSLAERFANPNIKDGLARICSESSAKLPVFLVPTILENLANGGNFQRGAILLAAWFRYHERQTSESGVPLEVIDQRAEELHRRAREGARQFMELRDIFGGLADNENFLRVYEGYVAKLHQGMGARQLMWR